MSHRLPETVADALIDKLGHDDSFRDLFCTDPRGALASLGFGPASDPGVTQGIWACMKVDQLASKEAILAGREQLRVQLSQRALFTPFNLDVHPGSKAA
jgi:putative modified peptide